MQGGMENRDAGFRKLDLAIYLLCVRQGFWFCRTSCRTSCPTLSWLDQSRVIEGAGFQTISIFMLAIRQRVVYYYYHACHPTMCSVVLINDYYGGP